MLATIYAVMKGNRMDTVINTVQHVAHWIISLSIQDLLVIGLWVLIIRVALGFTIRVKGFIHGISNHNPQTGGVVGGFLPENRAGRFRTFRLGVKKSMLAVGLHLATTGVSVVCFLWARGAAEWTTGGEITPLGAVGLVSMVWVVVNMVILGIKWYSFYIPRLFDN